MMEEQTILNPNNQADNDYLNNLAVAVCINGDKLDKYKKIVKKKYSKDVYNNLKQFVNELHGHLKRKKITNTSKVNLVYLGENAGLTEPTIDKIIRHVESKIIEKRKKTTIKSFFVKKWPLILSMLKKLKSLILNFFKRTKKNKRKG